MTSTQRLRRTMPRLARRSESAVTSVVALLPLALAVSRWTRPIAGFVLRRRRSRAAALLAGVFGAGFWASSALVVGVAVGGAIARAAFRGFQGSEQTPEA